MNSINKTWKTRTILLGTLIGALSGLFAAFIIIQQAEKNNAKLKLNAGEGVKLGMGVLGLLRLVSDTVNNK
jgi:hypothetical protein